VRETEMKKFDVEELEFSVADILGQQALFTDLHIDKATVPEGVYYYALRHGDDDSFPATVEKAVTIDYFGAVLLTKELHFGENSYLPLTEDDFWLAGELMTLTEFKQQPQPFSSGSSLAAYFMQTFDITAEEADMVFQYLTEHKYVIGEKNGELFLRNEHGKWKRDSVDGVIDLVCKWNHASVQLTGNKLEDLKYRTGRAELWAQHFKLLEDEKLLDGLFNRTDLGKRIKKLAEEIVADLVQNPPKPEKLAIAVGCTAWRIMEFRHEEAFNNPDYCLGSTTSLDLLKNNKESEEN